MQKNKGFMLFKNSLISISVPVGVFIIFQLICSFSGVSFISSANFKSFIVNVFYVTFIGWGLFFNVPAGRFDFSVGSVVVLAPMISGNIALTLGLDAIGMVIVCTIVGLILGTISGLAYVLLKIPAMVVSLGIALIFEAFTFILFDAKGTVLIGKNNMLYMIQIPQIFILGAVVLAVLIVIVNFTKFGYNLRSLASGQQISVNTGINEKLVAVLCYAACGSLSAIAGVTTLSRTGTMSAQLGLSTIMTMFLGFLPMFIGGILAKYSEPMTGILMGGIATALIAGGFAALGVKLAGQNIINAFILLGFLIFSMNQHKFKEFTMIRKRKHDAVQNQ